MDKLLWKLENVTLSGSPLERLRDITLEIRRGVTAVLGPSGAGKTSLLDLLVGFEKPDEGNITHAVERGSHALPVYWVPQTGGLWPHLRAREHLERVIPFRREEKGTGAFCAEHPSGPTGKRLLSPFPPVGGPTHASQADVTNMLASFDLSDKCESYPDQLSQGQQSRLAVARALLADAAVLVMDEPLAHVDTAQAARYWEIIRSRLDASGTSLVFATHSPKTVLAEAEHVICVREGRLLYEGELSELYRRPATRELAECLGETNWLLPEEGRLWFNEQRKEAFCLRPEQVSITPGADSAVVVRRSRFKGDVAEVELEHKPTGKVRRFYHRPSGDTLRAGDRVLLKALFLFLLLFLVSCGGAKEPSLAVREVGYWSMPADGAKIPAPRSLAIGPNDEVVVVDTSGRVLVFASDGTLQRQWRMPEVEVGRPEGVCVLKDGRIVVSDTHYHRIIVFDENGNTVGKFGGYGKGPGEFIYPVGVVRDDQDNLYVCEYGSNDRVQKFTSDGRFLLAFGSFGTEPGQFQRPSGMAWDDGKLYVADAVNNRIQVFSDGGRFLGGLEPSGRGESKRNEGDAKPDSSGWGTPLALDFPYDLKLAHDGALYVVEYGAGRVSKVALDGRLLGRFGSPGTGEGQFRTPWGIAIDSKMRLLIADTGNRRIVELKL